jgi:hypothetical protein
MRRFFTKTRMRRLLSLGPPNYSIRGTYKSGLDREAPKSNLSNGGRGFYSPPGRCARRGEGYVHLGACEGAMCGGAAGGRAGLDAVCESEVM